PATRVVNREHDAIAEAVVALAVVAADDEARRIERRSVISGERRREVLPARRRIADAEMRGDHPRQSPALQIRDRSRRILELRAIEPGGGEQRFIEVLRNLARLAL